jgi:hypothetical protein
MRHRGERSNSFSSLAAEKDGPKYSRAASSLPVAECDRRWRGRVFSAAECRVASVSIAFGNSSLIVLDREFVMRAENHCKALYYDTALELAVQVLQTEDAALDWLCTSHHALRNRRPVDMVNTREGMRLVHSLLNAIHD